MSNLWGHTWKKIHFFSKQNILSILSEHGLWFDGKWFCLFDIRFVDDFWYGLTYNVVSCTIVHYTPIEDVNNLYQRNSFLTVTVSYLFTCNVRAVNFRFMIFKEEYIIDLPYKMLSLKSATHKKLQRTTWREEKTNTT